MERGTSEVMWVPADGKPRLPLASECGRRFWVTLTQNPGSWPGYAA